MKGDIKEVFPVSECKTSNAILLLLLYRRQKLFELFLKNDKQKLNSEYMYSLSKSIFSFNKMFKNNFYHTHIHKILLILLAAVTQRRNA